tara:strand:+ start:201 stop:1265 length:1065 start_codon:yes stop_codon:yes gene_type:complete
LEPSEHQLRAGLFAWKHSSILREEKYKYLHLYAKQKDLIDFSPDPESYRESRDKIISQRKASQTAKVDFGDSCFFDALPTHQLKEWFHVRSQALTKLRDTVAEPGDYKILHKAHILAQDVASRKLRFEDKYTTVRYNIFGSVTGRFTTFKKSAPVLTLKKEQRQHITPKNDAFVEIDYNAAELRTLFALSKIGQPKGDIHEWVSKNVFKGSLSREESKVKLFSWLYNFSASDVELSKFFSREIFRDFYIQEDQLLETPFGRKISVEERKAQNYLLQSTTSDIVVDRAYEIMRFLKNKKTKIAFTLHDSIILDFSREDVKLLRELVEMFETTSWGKFKSSCHIGKNFGSLKEIRL